MADTANTLAPKRDLTGYALAISGAILFSTKGVFIKLGYGAGLATETILALRMIVAVPFYIVIAAWILSRRPELAKTLRPSVILAAGAVGALGYYVASYVNFLGLAFVSAQYERLVLFTYPFFTFALGIAFFGDRMNWRVIPGLLMSYCGLAVIFGWNLVVSPDGLVEGTLLILASGLAFALYQHLARGRMKLIGAGLFTCIGMGTAGLLAIAHQSVVHGPTALFGLSAEAWLIGLALGTLGTVAPSFLLNNAIKRIGARSTSATGGIGPVATIAMAVVILGEPFTLTHAIGTALVIGGVLWFSRADTS